MNGTALQTITTNNILAHGQALTVTRLNQSDGSTTTSSIYFLPQPLNATGGGNLNLEAGYNAGEENPYDFVASGAADVTENDKITYNGFKWRVLNTNPQVLGGVAVSLHCYAVREQAV